MYHIGGLLMLKKLMPRMIRVRWVWIWICASLSLIASLVLYGSLWAPGCTISRHRLFGERDQHVSAHLTISPRGKHQHQCKMMTLYFTRKVQYNSMRDIGSGDLVWHCTPHSHVHPITSARGMGNGDQGGIPSEFAGNGCELFSHLRYQNYCVYKHGTSMF